MVFALCGTLLLLGGSAALFRHSPFASSTIALLALSLPFAVDSETSPSTAGVVFAAGLLFMTPSLLGQQNGRLSIALLSLGGYLALLTVPFHSRTTSLAAIIRSIAPTALVAVYWWIVQSTGSTRASAVYLSVAALALVPICLNRRAILAAIRCYAAASAAMGWLWLVAVALRLNVAVPHIDGTPYGRPGFMYDAYFPGAITSVGHGFLGLPRLSGITGEPGLAAIMCAAAACAGLAFTPSGRRRNFVVSGGLIGLVATQSTAALIACLPAAALVLAHGQTKAGHHVGRRTVRILAAAAVVGVTALVFTPLIHAKLVSNSRSLTDRGIVFSQSGLAFNFASTRISMLSALGVDGIRALLPIISAVWVLIGLRRSNPLALLALTVLIIGLIAQPLSFQLGVWVFFSLALCALRPTGDGT